MTVHPSAVRPRQGFTLIELLVVVAIIAVLMGLTGMAISGIMRSQYIATTQTTIQKLTSEVDRHWKAVSDTARAEFRNGAPPAVQALAASDPDKAQNVWIRLRLMQEFPQTFAEATGGVQYIDEGPDGNLGTMDDVTYSIGPKSNYQKALAGKNLGGDLDAESSACLYLALSSSRRGTTSDLEAAVGPSSIKMIDDGTGQKLALLLDAWGMPIGYRHPRTHRGWEANRNNPYQLYSAGPDKLYEHQNNKPNDLLSNNLRQVGARGDK